VLPRSLIAALFAVIVGVAAFGSGSFGDIRVAEAVTIGPGSCQGLNACVALDPGIVIGANSCNGQQACTDISGSVGDNSCNGLQACFVIEDSDIGNGSCNGTQSCVGLQGASIGDRSCIGQQSCVVAEFAAVGDRSCYGVQTCVVVHFDIGDDSCYEGASCVVETGPIGDCEFNPGCEISVSKTANPGSIPESGGVPVTYVVRIDFEEDEWVNFIHDDQYMLDPSTQCHVFSPQGADLGGILLPDGFAAGYYIICRYTQVLPPGPVGSTHDNTVTVNVGNTDLCTTSAQSVLPSLNDLPALQNLPEGIHFQFSDLAAQVCAESVTAASIGPGEVAGTADVSDTASVLYVASEQQRPNIGAGLSGLFAGGNNNPAAKTQPAPVPTLIGSSSERSPIIRPPNTGDAGLAHRNGGDNAVVFAALSIAIVGAATLLLTRRRI
jgi:hypothetical protein